MTLLYSALILIGLCLTVTRANSVIAAFDDWNYFVHRYVTYCGVNYSHEEKHPNRIQNNYVTKTEAFLVFFAVWKMDATYYFSFKPDADEIIEMYINKR
jgi:hypothetical protein